MNYYLIIFKDNWADEFDVEGFYIVNEEEKDTMMSCLDNAVGREIYFGTNEFFEYQTKREVAETITVTPLSNDSAQLLLRNFPNGFGEVCVLDHLRYVQPCDDCGCYEEECICDGDED